MSPMEKLTSTDGTKIAFTRNGQGLTLVIITGALNYHNFGVPSDLIPLLQDDFTVIAYDRRGRGDSTDTSPWSLAREIEDIDALLAHSAGPAFLYGHSSGAALALHATVALQDKVQAVAAFEPPLVSSRKERLGTRLLAYAIRLMVKCGKKREVVLRFMRFVGMSESLIVDTMASEHGPKIEAMAGTIAYEARIQLASNDFLKHKAQSIHCPCLMLAGDASFPGTPATMQVFTKAIPGAKSCLLSGQTHSVEASVLAPILREFFLESSR